MSDININVSRDGVFTALVSVKQGHWTPEKALEALIAAKPQPRRFTDPKEHAAIALALTVLENVGESGERIDTLRKLWAESAPESERT